MLKTIIAVVIIALVAIGIMVFTKPGMPTGKDAGHTVVSNTTYKWFFSSKTEKDGVPSTDVVLNANGKTYNAGTFTGSCSEINGTSWKLLPGEKSGVICFFAGAGRELGLFEEKGTMVLKVGELDEGSAEVAGTRGNFKTLTTL